MHITTSTLLLAAAALLPNTISADANSTLQPSSKRGLVFIPSTKYPSDNQIWVETGSDLTWYYNYGAAPSLTYSNRTQAEFEFVPMLWSPTTTFLTDVQGLISGGRNITHIMTYNEPDGASNTGGSNVDPTVAAKNWISQVEPLRKLGVKTGAPAVTGAPSGATWLKNFFAACASQGTNCTTDFIPIHWYGNFAGLTNHFGDVAASYPNISIWITEYALNNVSLPETQDFFNTSAEYFDRLPYVERYSYFGSFRSDVSNVGPNVAMLNNKGELTDIGSWYLGGKATGTQPTSIATTTTIFGSWSTLVIVMAAMTTIL